MKILTVIAHPNPASFCHALLKEFTRGLNDAGHTCEVVDLYAIHFNPVFHVQDFASYVHESIPADVLESMNLKKYVVNAAQGPLQKYVAARWLRDKDTASVARFIHAQRPKDVIAQWEKIQRAEGLAFIAPVFWLGFPAILKGWFERVFSYGDAYALTSEGWAGSDKGRIPLLKHQKALVISTTLFREEDYQAKWKEPMTRIIDDWGLRYPGIKQVEHVYFYAVPVVNDEIRQGYLKRAYQLGLEFENT